jgi:hypothetical protein
VLEKADKIREHRPVFAIRCGDAYSASWVLVGKDERLERVVPVGGEKIIKEHHVAMH